MIYHSYKPIDGGLILGQRRRQWAYIKIASAQRLGFIWIQYKVTNYLAMVNIDRITYLSHYNQHQ